MSKKELIQRIFLGVLVASVFIVGHRLYRLQGYQLREFSGKTMGTTYTIKFSHNQAVDVDEIKKKVDKLLIEINRQMSTYISDSEISRFNQHKSSNEFKVSEDFYRVLKQSMRFYYLTWGLFDPTVSPLINLWGFGHEGRKESTPKKEDIFRAMKNVGLKLIKLEKNNTLRKIEPRVALNLSAIAKGYGVDVVSSLISEMTPHYLVEIGGEVKAGGLKDPYKKKPWKVGIEKPNYEQKIVLQKSIDLKDLCVASSGDYRNFYKRNGKRISHTINPKTGLPAEVPVVAVTVFAKSCMDADALATALMVGGENLLFSMPPLAGVSGFLLVSKEGELTEVPF